MTISIHDTKTTGQTGLKSSNGWLKVRFDALAENIVEHIEVPSESGYDRFVGGDHLDSGSLKISRWGSTNDVEAQKLLFKKGHILFGKRNAYLRKVAYADFDGVCSAHMMVLKAKPDYVLEDFLPFFMQTDQFWERALMISEGSMSPTIKWKTLALQEFVIPPKDEQRRIADILWAADEMYQKQSYMFNPIFILRQILIDQLMTNFAQNSGCLVQLGAVCNMQNGRSFPSEEYSNEGIRLLRPGNLDKSGYLVWSDDNTRFLPGSYRSLASEYLINPGDVVINLTTQSLEDGFMGRVCMAREEEVCLLNQRIGRFICNESFLPEYLYRCLQTTSFRKLVESSCEGSKIKHLYWRHIENFPIPLPSLEEQKLIVQVLTAMDCSRDSAEKNLKNTKLLRELLREKLLSAN